MPNGTALPKKLHSGHDKATGEESDEAPPGKRDLESETGTSGFKYSWMKIEAAAPDRTGWRKVVCGLRSTGSDKA